MRRGARAGWAVAAGCAAGVSVLLAATPPTPAAAAPSISPTAGEPAPAAAAAQPAEKPPALLDVALLSADRWAIARMRSETHNLTWQMGQLATLTRLLARAGRFDQALALIEHLDTPARVKVQDFLNAASSREIVFTRGTTEAVNLVAASYGEGTVSSGNVRLVYDPETKLEGKHILLVEDIVDSGRTLAKVMDVLRERAPASLEVCAMLDKHVATHLTYPPKFVGFDSPPEFLVGYGLDHAENFRHLPYIASLQ